MDKTPDKKGLFDDVDEEALFAAIAVAVVLVCLKILFS